MTKRGKAHRFLVHAERTLKRAKRKDDFNLALSAVLEYHCQYFVKWKKKKQPRWTAKRG